MATEIQFRRYDSSEIDTLTGKVGEIFIEMGADDNQDNPWLFRIQDGETVGGKIAGTSFENIIGDPTDNTALVAALDQSISELPFEDITGDPTDNPALVAALDLKSDLSNTVIKVGTAPQTIGSDVEISGRVDAANMKFGSADIASSVSEVSVTFDPLDDVPVSVIAIVRKDAASDANIFATIQGDSISDTGFTAHLSGTTPNSNYKLDYWIVY